MKSKKPIILILILVFIIIVCFILFFSKSDKLEFAGKRFYRSTSSCGENLYFTEEYKMGYYEDCGNPVDNFDLCENYRYKKITNEIIVECDGFTEKFKVIKYVPGKELTLERDNKTLIFEEVKR